MDVELSEQGAPSFTEAAAEPSSLEAQLEPAGVGVQRTLHETLDSTLV